MKKCICFFVSIVFLSGCSKWFDEDNNPYAGMNEPKLYAYAEAALKKGDYTEAVKRLEGLDTMYPFSSHAQSAQLDLIYAYCKKEEYASCAATADRYIRLYPRYKQVDYAYYMRGVANFEQKRGTFAKMVNLDESWRDAGTQLQAYQDFKQLAERFPSSKYTSDAIQRMIYLRNIFANKELHIAKYYMRRKMYVAARNRADYLVKNFQQAPQAEEALAIMVKANHHLKLYQAEKDAKTVLRATYPKSRWS